MRTRLESLANSLERSPTLLLGVFFLCYALSLIMPIQRWLWHDELFTYYIAQAPDMRALLWQSRHLDLNPPMVYIVTRAWQHLFGTNELVARLTSIFAFGLASFGFIVYLKRRVGWLWACAAIALFWASPSFIYASELRPYALVLFFFSMTLLAWDTADSGTHRLPALTALIIGGFGLMLCHVLAVFPLGAIYLGELFRTVRRKSLDWPVWLCLLLPLLLIPTYFVSSQLVETSSYPPIFQAGPRRLFVYAAKTALGLAQPFLLAALVACIVRPPREWRILTSGVKSIRAPDAGLWLGLMLIPILITLAILRSHGAFFDRYCLATSLAIAVTVMLLLAAVTGFQRLAALCTLIAPFTFSVFMNLVNPLLHPRNHSPLLSERLHSNLPVVVASGLTFLQLDHYEKTDFLAHTYYLTDRASALRYANASIFEGMPIEARYFPFRAKVNRFRDFVRANHRFLVFGTVSYPEDWLLRRVEAEGATVRLLISFQSDAYKDHDVYEITIPDGSPLLAAQ